MENKKGSNVFLAVIGVATLIVAIIGATFAYFSATANSAEGAVTAESTSLALGYEDTNGTNLKANMIPASDAIAIYAANVQTGTGTAANQQCIDDNGNEVCSVYQFTIGNPSKTTAQTINGVMDVTVNGFANLYYAIYEIDNSGTLVSDPVVNATLISNGAHTGENAIELTALNQTLAPSKAADDADSTLLTTEPSAYTLYTQTVGSATQYNKRTYRIILWIHEAGQDNVNADVSKQFAAQIKFDTGTGVGVTGVIAGAGV